MIYSHRSTTADRFGVAMAAGPRSRPQCLHRLVGQLLHHVMMNRLPHPGQRKLMSANQVTTLPTQHAPTAT